MMLGVLRMMVYCMLCVCTVVCCMLCVAADAAVVDVDVVVCC